MTVHSKELLNKALKLPPTERAELVEQLITSFDFPDRDEIDALWAHEVEERIEAYDAGKIKSVPAAKVFARVDRRLRR